MAKRLDDHPPVRSRAPIALATDEGGDAPFLVAFRGMTWALVTLRRPARCLKCESDLPRGAEAFRPLTNRKDRGLRICAHHWRAAP